MLRSMMSRGGFSELGAPGKYKNRALYICTHLPRSPLRFLFCRDACCCTMLPHSCVQCFYIFHVHVIMGCFHLHLHLFIQQTLLFFHVVDHEIAIDLPLRYNK